VQPVEEKDAPALVPLTAAERFLYQDDCNLLACHTDRLEGLRAAFPHSI
jgi:hypothetical protein